MFWNYLKMAYKVLLRRKFFTFISLFGIGFTLLTMLVFFTLADHVVDPPGPSSRADGQIILNMPYIWLEHMENNDVYHGELGYYFIEHYLYEMKTPSGISAYTGTRDSACFVNDRKVRVQLRQTDAAYWRLLDFDFLEGGPLTESDDKGDSRALIISHYLKRKVFGNEPAVGKELVLDGRAYRIRGVVKNVPFYDDISYADAWQPIDNLESANYRNQMLGRFKVLFMVENANQAAAFQEELAHLWPKVQIPDPEQFNFVIGHAETPLESMARDLLRDGNTDDNGKSTLVMIAIALGVLFMFLPAINLININVSRIMERAVEIGVRKAFGASSTHLVGQLIFENIFLTLVGGLLALLATPLVLEPINQSGLIPHADLTMNPRVFLGGLLLIFLFGALSGIYPAWKMSRLHPVSALKGGDS